MAGEPEVDPDLSFSPHRDMRDEVLEHGEYTPGGEQLGDKSSCQHRGPVQGAVGRRVSLLAAPLTPELTVADRRQKREIRQLEQELHKWQVLVDSITGEEAGASRAVPLLCPLLWPHPEPLCFWGGDPPSFPRPLDPCPLPRVSEGWALPYSVPSSATGMSSPDFDSQTLAVLRGRMVRYLMRSREVRRPSPSTPLPQAAPLPKAALRRQPCPH